jgi:hypothetical protein
MGIAHFSGLAALILNLPTPLFPSLSISGNENEGMSAVTIPGEKDAFQKHFSNNFFARRHFDRQLQRAAS